MSTRVVVEEVVRRPRGEVAAFVSDWRNDTTWIRALSESRVTTDGELGVGSRVLRVASFLGKRIEYENEIVEYVPGERLAMKSVRAPFPMDVTYEFEDADGGTRVRIRTEGDASGFYRIAGPMLARAVKKGIEEDLRQLKDVLESRR